MSNETNLMGMTEYASIALFILMAVAAIALQPAKARLVPARQRPARPVTVRRKNEFSRPAPQEE